MLHVDRILHSCDAANVRAGKMSDEGTSVVKTSLQGAMTVSPFLSLSVVQVMAGWLVGGPSNSRTNLFGD